MTQSKVKKSMISQGQKVLVEESLSQRIMREHEVYGRVLVSKGVSTSTANPREPGFIQPITGDKS